MDAMNIKQYLSQAQHIERNIEAKREDIARMRARLTDGTAQISDMPRGGGQHGLDDAIARIIEYEEYVNREIARLCDLKTEIRDVIASVSNPVHRELLELRYINGYSWRRVAKAMHYSSDRIWHLHSDALKALSRQKKTDNDVL